MSTAIQPASDNPSSLAEQSSNGSSRMEMIIPGTALTFGDTARLAKTLFLSGLLGAKVKSAEQAFAIIVAGAEMGLPPMLSLRSISMVEGKPVLAADAQLGAFKRAGGRTRFEELTEKVAVLWLRHPNGDEHTETWTEQMAATAGLLNKDNWKKHRVAMMRSRVITAGLKSIGFEATAGTYDPDEEQHLLETEGVAPVARDSLASPSGAAAKLKALVARPPVLVEEAPAGGIPAGVVADVQTAVDAEADLAAQDAETARLDREREKELLGGK